MYLQIGLRPEDRDVCRFLWQEADDLATCDDRIEEIQTLIWWKDGNQLTILELQEAEKRWVKEVQVGAFPINRIEAGSTELPKSSPIASLCSFLEMEGLLHVGGRLTNVVRRCPGVINTPGLPNDGMIVALIVQRTQLTTKIMDSNLATKLSLMPSIT
ncbi:hypothetical protein T03_3922 [Trichinella britovi]|uniref:Uncharacterized protein n=1 Tax=Trichinella britovi TaxID=45882 RepID=A0A0V1D2Z1_TRIBR|nr:hypothetical protein T03_3922 [Trichinella britovi]